MASNPIVEALTQVLEEAHLVVSPPVDGHHEVLSVKGGLKAFLEVGDKVKSSDLDDFQTQGFKVKEEK